MLDDLCSCLALESLLGRMEASFQQSQLRVELSVARLHGLGLVLHVRTDALQKCRLAVKPPLSVLLELSRPQLPTLLVLFDQLLNV